MCYRSLKAMGIDCVDLYYVHRVDPKVPIEITMEAMNELIAEGKIKAPRPLLVINYFSMVLGNSTMKTQ